MMAARSATIISDAESNKTIHQYIINMKDNSWQSFMNKGAQGAQGKNAGAKGAANSKGNKAAAKQMNRRTQ